MSSGKYGYLKILKHSLICTRDGLTQDRRENLEAECLEFDSDSPKHQTRLLERTLLPLADAVRLIRVGLNGDTSLENRVNEITEFINDARLAVMEINRVPLSDWKVTALSHLDSFVRRLDGLIAAIDHLQAPERVDMS